MRIVYHRVRHLQYLHFYDNLKIEFLYNSERTVSW